MIMSNWKNLYDLPDDLSLDFCLWGIFFKSVSKDCITGSGISQNSI